MKIELGTSYEQYLESTWYAPAIAANPNVTFLAATGDGSAVDGPIFPSISPLTVAVGGTSLFTSDGTEGDQYSTETAWSGGGGGPSETFPLPTYQQGVVAANYGPLTVRTAPDIAAVANPGTGVSVYEPELYGGWVQVGGTSVATPITAATIGIADQGRVALGGQPLGGPSQTLPALYAAYESGNAYTPGTGYFNDITVGSNGYEAGPGYDLTSGIGSEQAENLLPFLALYDLGPAVTSSDPAQSQVVTTTPPTQFSLTFSQQIDPNSVVAGDFTVNGVPANSDTLSPDDTTIYYTFTSSPVVNQGVETMNLPAYSVIGLNTGQPNHAAFNATFYYVNTQLQVTATSPASGSLINIPSAPGTIDLVVQFNEAINPYSISTSDFQVSEGSVTSAIPLTPQAVDLTISGVTQDGMLTLTIPAGAFTDSYGVPGLGFTGNYVINFASLLYPTPLTQQPPAGSLIYDPTTSGAVGFAGNTNTYTLDLAAGQVLSLAMTPDSSLTGTVTLEGPGGATIGSATGPRPGVPVVLEAAPITTAGTYTLIVGGTGGTSGTYTLQAILNAIYKPSTLSINTIGTAFSLSRAFESLGTTPSASAAGIVGTLGTVPSDFYGFPLTYGESASIAVKGTNGTASLALYSSSGELLADGAPGAAGSGVDSVISGFVAQASGTYYLEVTGAAGLTYDAVVTRGAEFGLHGDTFAKAQPLNGASVVLGAIVTPASPLQALDLHADSYSNIYQTDAATGAFGSSILSPVNDAFYLFGQNMAYDGTYTYYNDGYGGSNEIYELDSAGTVVSPGNPVPDGGFTGLAYLDGSLYGADVYGDIYKIDPNTWTVTGVFYQPDLYPLVGLTGDPDNGMLYAVSQFHELYEIDPTNGSIIWPRGPTTRGSLRAGHRLRERHSDRLRRRTARRPWRQRPRRIRCDHVRVPPDGSTRRTRTRPRAWPATAWAATMRDWYPFNVNAGDNLGSRRPRRAAPRQRPPVQQRPGADDQPLRRQRQPGRHRDRQRTRRPQRRHRLDGAHARAATACRSSARARPTWASTPSAIKGATGGRPFNGHLDQPGRRIATRLPGLDHGRSRSAAACCSRAISPSDFTIDGNAATGFTVVNNDTSTSRFPTTANGVHNVSISGVVDIQGVTRDARQLLFTTDDVPPVRRFELDHRRRGLFAGADSPRS